MTGSTQLHTSPRDFGDIRCGDDVYLKAPVEATPLRQLAWQHFRDQIGSVGPFIVQRISCNRALLCVSGSTITLELPLQTLTRERPLASSPQARIPSLTGFSFGPESKRVA